MFSTPCISTCDHHPHDFCEQIGKSVTGTKIYKTPQRGTVKHGGLEENINDTVMKDNRNKWLILLRHKVSFSNLSNSQMLGLSTSSLHQQYNVSLCLKQPLLSPHPWHLPLSIKIGDYEKSSLQRLLVHNHPIPFTSINGVQLLHIRLGWCNDSGWSHQQRGKRDLPESEWQHWWRLGTGLGPRHDRGALQPQQVEMIK